MNAPDIPARQCERNDAFLGAVRGGDAAAAAQPSGYDSGTSRH